MEAWVDDPKLYEIKKGYQVSPNNLLSLEKFFIDHKWLNRGEKAIAAGRSPHTLRKWEIKCGIRDKLEPIADAPTTPEAEVEEVRDPKIWDNYNWFYQKYVVEELGIHLISRIIGRKYLTVYRRLKKFKIPRRENNKSKNPCCSEDWLMYHYATPRQYRLWCQKKKMDIDPNGGQCLTQRECAKLAGTSMCTIYNWLIKFEIPVRDRLEALHYSKLKKNGHLKGPLEL